MNRSPLKSTKREASGADAQIHPVKTAQLIKLPWFRAYAEMVDDEKLKLLAFEDRWHFMALLCIKGQGLLDKDESFALMLRKVAVKMGLDLRTLEEVARRLEEVGLIDKETLQPLKWNDRQMRSDADPTAIDRKRRQRDRARADADSDSSRGHSDNDSAAAANAAIAAAAHVSKKTIKNIDLKVVTDVSRVTVTDVTRTDTDIDTDTEVDTEKEEETPKYIFPSAAQPVAVACADSIGKSETQLQSACRATWSAYCEAYQLRYGVMPVRNAQVNSKIKAFVTRIGTEESPAVADYFVARVNDSFVVRGVHDVGILLQRAEAFRTQWATGQVMTSTKALQADRTATNLGAFAGMIEEARHQKGTK